MKTRYAPLTMFFCLALASGCAAPEEPDAYGNFEASEWTVPSGGDGPLVAFDVQEGQSLEKNQVVALIDTVQLVLQRRQLQARISALRASLPDAGAQLQVLEQKMAAIVKERDRIRKLVEAGAASEKKTEQAEDELKVIRSEIKAVSSQLSRETAGQLGQIRALEAQLESVQDLIARCTIRNPEQGVVLETYTRVHEYVSTGRPLYRLADLTEMELKAWFAGNQLSQIQIGGTVQVAVDAPDSLLRFPGTVVRVAEKPEFTPSQVQSKDQRAHMLYEVTIRVANDGHIKPGMPGEVYLETR